MAHCKVVNLAVIVNLVEGLLVKLAKLEFVHYAQIAEILIHNLAVVEAAHIVDAGVEAVSATVVGLEAAAEVLVLLEHAHIVAFLAQNSTALKSAQSAANDYDVVFHTSEIRGQR